MFVVDSCYCISLTIRLAVIRQHHLAPSRSLAMHMRASSSPGPPAGALIPCSSSRFSSTFWSNAIGTARGSPMGSSASARSARCTWSLPIAGQVLKPAKALVFESSTGQRIGTRTGAGLSHDGRWIVEARERVAHGKPVREVACRSPSHWQQSLRRFSRGWLSARAPTFVAERRPPAVVLVIDEPPIRSFARACTSGYRRRDGRRSGRPAPAATRQPMVMLGTSGSPTSTAPGSPPLRKMTHFVS